MGVSIRKKGNKWFVFINHKGNRKAKCVGDSRAAAVRVQQVIQAKLALGDMRIRDLQPKAVPSFENYAGKWLKECAELTCKPSTVTGYKGVLKLYLQHRFGPKRIDEIKRTDVKELIGAMVSAGLSRSTLRNTISVLRCVLNHAIEDGLLESNPAANLGKFTRSARQADPKGISLTPQEIAKFLKAAKEICPRYYALFLVAVRAGLRRGELVALRWGDFKLGNNESDPNRFILVRHNFVRRAHTTTKSKKTRRVDISRELRRELLALRSEHLKAAKAEGKDEISADLVFPASDGNILDPDNLYHRLFVPVLRRSRIRKCRLHDLRHSFGSLLIQKGASLVYVRDQMGHSSIQVTADIYAHLVPGADVNMVDMLDGKPERKARNRRPNCNPSAT
jgi:integrase